jgi:hypothetical protein
MHIAVGRSFAVSTTVRKFSATICKPQQSSPSARLFSSENDSQQTETAGLKLLISTAEDMEDVGGLIASVTLEDKKAAGSIIFLMGDLGAGKTAFARGFLRAATGNINLRVTSPTYLLANAYPANAGVGSNKKLEYVSS